MCAESQVICAGESQEDCRIKQSSFSVGRDEGRAENGRTGLTKTTLFLSLATGLPNHSQRQGSYHRRYNPGAQDLGTSVRT